MPHLFACEQDLLLLRLHLLLHGAFFVVSLVLRLILLLDQIVCHLGHFDFSIAASKKKKRKSEYWKEPDHVQTP